MHLAVGGLGGQLCRWSLAEAFQPARRRTEPYNPEAFPSSALVNHSLQVRSQFATRSTLPDACHLAHPRAPRQRIARSPHRPAELLRSLRARLGNHGSSPDGLSDPNTRYFHPPDNAPSHLSCKIGRASCRERV